VARGFNEHEKEVIGKKLLESAQKYASTIGMRKTSLDQITADAGISKPMFYKFYETKEHLFLKVIEDWHHELIQTSLSIIRERTELPMKERLVQCIMNTIRYMDKRSMTQLLAEDVPYINRKIPDAVQAHYVDHESILQPVIRAAGVRFKVDFELVSALIHTLIWTAASKEEIGPRYYDAAELLARATIEYVVEE